MDNLPTGGEMIRVEVAFATPDQQEIVELQVEQGCTAKEAVDKSGIADRFPAFPADSVSLGIFSRPLNGVDLPSPDDYVLADGDRVEIYRPLAMDPKQARLERLKKQSARESDK